MVFDPSVYETAPAATETPEPIMTDEEWDSDGDWTEEELLDLTDSLFDEPIADATTCDDNSLDFSIRHDIQMCGQMDEETWLNMVDLIDELEVINGLRRSGMWSLRPPVRG